MIYDILYIDNTCFVKKTVLNGKQAAKQRLTTTPTNMESKSKIAIIYFLLIISINLFDCSDEKKDESQADPVNISNMSSIDNNTNDGINANNNQTTSELSNNNDPSDEDGDAIEICNKTFSIPKGINTNKIYIKFHSHYHSAFS